MQSVFLEGLLLQASLILALGAQNLFVLESGLKQQHPIAISFTCFLCDLILIMIGVGGAASLLMEFYQLKIVFGILGVAFMVFYGFGKLKSDEKGLLGTDSLLGLSLKRSVILSITFSLLNPHAYLDAIVLIGGYSTKYAELSDRLMIGLGAACFSLIWFLTLSCASSTIRPLVESPKRMRFISSLSGVFLIFLAGKLGGDVIGWIGDMMNDPHCSLLGACSPVVTLNQ